MSAFHLILDILSVLTLDVKFLIVKALAFILVMYFYFKSCLAALFSACRSIYR